MVNPYAGDPLHEPMGASSDDELTPEEREKLHKSRTEPLAVGKRKRSRMIGARVEAEVARIQEQQSNPSRQVISDLSKGRPTSSFRGLNFQKDNNKAAIPTSSQALAAGNKATAIQSLTPSSVQGTLIISPGANRDKLTQSAPDSPGIQSKLVSASKSSGNQSAQFVPDSSRIQSKLVSIPQSSEKIKAQMSPQGTSPPTSQKTTLLPPTSNPVSTIPEQKTLFPQPSNPFPRIHQQNSSPSSKMARPVPETSKITPATARPTPEARKVTPPRVRFAPEATQTTIAAIQPSLEATKTTTAATQPSLEATKTTPPAAQSSLLAPKANLPALRSVLKATEPTTAAAHPNPEAPMATTPTAPSAQKATKTATPAARPVPESPESANASSSTVPGRCQRRNNPHPKAAGEKRKPDSVSRRHYVRRPTTKEEDSNRCAHCTAGGQSEPLTPHGRTSDQVRQMIEMDKVVDGMNEEPEVDLDLTHHLHPILQTNTLRMIERPTRCQLAFFQYVQKRTSLIFTSPAGTGKELTVVLPILNRLLLDTMTKPKIDAIGHPTIVKPQTKSVRPQVLYLTSTKELAYKVYAHISKLLENSALRVALITHNWQDEEGIVADLLQHGADVVVGTPGRMFSVIRKRHVDTKALKFVVSDEAHELFKDLDLPRRDDKGSSLAITTGKILFNKDGVRRYKHASYIFISGVWNSTSWNICNFLVGPFGSHIGLRWSPDAARLPVEVVRHESKELQHLFDTIIDQFILSLDAEGKRIPYINHKGNPDCKRRPIGKTIIYVRTIQEADQLFYLFQQMSPGMGVAVSHHATPDAARERIGDDFCSPQGKIHTLITAGAWTQGHHIDGLKYLIVARPPFAHNPWALGNLVQFFSRSDSQGSEIRRVMLVDTADAREIEVIDVFRAGIEEGLQHLPIDSPNDAPTMEAQRFILQDDVAAD